MSTLTVTTPLHLLPDELAKLKEQAGRSGASLNDYLRIELGFAPEAYIQPEPRRTGHLRPVA